MKTIATTSSNLMLLTETVPEFVNLITALRAYDTVLDTQIKSYHADMAKVVDTDKNEHDMLSLYLSETVQKRHQNFAMIRKLDAYNFGYVDLEISPYILTTDLTTLRGWL